MPNRIGDRTRAEVHECADALLREGVRPAVNKILARLGHGSARTVQDGLNEWWEALPARLDAADHRPKAPAPIEALMAELWERAVEAAGAHWNDERARLEGQIGELTARAESAEAAHSEVNARLDSSTLHAAELRDELAGWRTRCAEHEQALVERGHALAEAERALAGAQERAATANTRADQAEARSQELLGQLHEQRGANEALTAEVTRLQHGIAEHYAALQAREARFDSWREALMAEHRAALAERDTQVEELRRRVGEQDRAMTQAQLERDACQARLAGEIPRLQAQLDALGHERETLRAALSEAQVGIAERETRVQSLREQLSVADQDMVRYQDTLQRLIERLSPTGAEPAAEGTQAPPKT